jgi:DNA repair protein RecO (recombination protein O)
MSHTLHTIEGIILNSYAVGEDSRVVLVLSDELGLIRVWAQGVRKQKSKLAGHVQDLCRSRMVVVRGREYWRLTDAQKQRDYQHLLSHKRSRDLLVRALQMLGRLAHEEHGGVLYQLTIALFEALETDEKGQIDIEALEIAYMLRMLQALGYGTSGYVEALFPQESFAPEILESVSKNKEVLVSAINEALTESQL